MIYKVCDIEAWETARAVGHYDGSADDLRDGYIHMSTATQLEGTLAKHFASREGLVLVAIDPDRFGDALRWEAARDGTLFPHLYSPLAVANAAWTAPLPLDPSGRHVLPAGVAP